MSAEDEQDDRAGNSASEPSSDPGKRFRENPPDDDEVDEIEEERARRLAPENRPDGAEIDNTGENMPDFIKEDLGG
jgi:hypothetical protein